MHFNVHLHICGQPNLGNNVLLMQIWRGETTYRNILCNILWNLLCIPLRNGNCSRKIERPEQTGRTIWKNLFNIIHSVVVLQKWDWVHSTSALWCCLFRSLPVIILMICFWGMILKTSERPFWIIVWVLRSVSLLFNSDDSSYRLDCKLVQIHKGQNLERLTKKMP